uniref:Putative metalloproteinase inhibitor tag-225 (inferred by orthology to a C. elegans protein) n=1 Tax=Strongyloides venezuelensis TaxID=75913 RepID=A0A0K0F1K2_STRVS
MFGTNILYHVEHIDTFKKPANETVLQNFIFTPQSGATCGIMGLEVNKKYLVSGSLGNGLLTISSCSQMHAEGSTDSFATPQEWAAVPTLQKNMLKDGCYNNCSVTVE